MHKWRPRTNAECDLYKLQYRMNVFGEWPTVRFKGDLEDPLAPAAIQ